MTRRSVCATLAASGLPPFFCKDSHHALWISVADRLAAGPPEAFPYDWGEGVQQTGLMMGHERTGNPRYLDWMRRWVAFHAKKPPAVLLNIQEPRGPEHAGYCGHWSPAMAIWLLHRVSPNPVYERIVNATVHYIRNRAERSPDGGLGHWYGSHQLWVDTLYMAVPVLCAVGRDRRDPALAADAAHQILEFARRLQNSQSGLFHHMWDWKTGERTPGPWGRGNGWVMMSLADAMEALDRGHASWAGLRAVLDRLLSGLAATQDRSGLWHTVLDDPSSYEECSATAMVVYGVLKLVRLGVLPGSRIPMVMKAWDAINTRFVKEGLVIGVSAGTVPKGENYYRALPAGTETWGTGAYLLAGSETARLP